VTWDERKKDQTNRTPIYLFCGDDCHFGVSRRVFELEISSLWYGDRPSVLVTAKVFLLQKQFDDMRTGGDTRKRLCMINETEFSQTLLCGQETGRVKSIT